MPSRFPTRRQLLSASGGSLAVALAGCTGFDSHSVSGTATDDGTFESSHEYETLFVRATDETPVAYPDAEAAEDDRDRPGRQYSGFFVTDADEAAALRLTVDGADAADVRDFVDATDFDGESIIVDQRRIDDCYRRRLLAVRANDDSIRTRYCRELKAPTTPCEAETTVAEAIFIRVHRPYDDHPSSRASSEGASCPDGDDDTAGSDTDGESTGEGSNDGNATDDDAGDGDSNTDDPNGDGDGTDGSDGADAENAEDGR